MLFRRIKMEFKAHPLSVDNLFSLRKQYYVSRNQREFSWVEEQLQEFWFDLISNIKYKEDKFEYQEYFLGAIVLAGNEDGFKLSIVDGQQRITVITLLISAICQKLKELNADSIGKGLYDSYIEGISIDDSDSSAEDAARYFKLDRQSESDFFKIAIQFYEKKYHATTNLEDELLKQAYDYFYEKLSSNESIIEIIKCRESDIDDSQRIKFIRAVIRQLTINVKIIRVIVDDEDDAYVIFEILNARGMDLDSADLIKNKIFSEMRKTHPVDYAEKAWTNMINELSERNKNFKLTTYIRHWWNAHYPVVSEGSLYKSFKQNIILGDIETSVFLERISEDVSVYSKILDPRFDDWREQHAKEIYYSLLALKIFNVSICRPFLLALFESFNKKKLRYKDLAETIKTVEKFHFIFNAIGSMRPSGVENTYSAISRKLLSSANNSESRAILSELKDKLRNRLPSEAAFTQKFKDIKFTNKKTTHRKLIQYIFASIERKMRGNDELIPLDITLEHVSSQSTNRAYVGMIGNLIPLGAKANVKADTKGLPVKLKLYEQSNFLYTKDFYIKHNTETEWTDELIMVKTSDLASWAYNDIWKF